MQYVYDAVLNVRKNIKNELSSKLSKGKVKNEQDREILFRLDLLKQVRYRLTQSPDKWSEAGWEVINTVFDNHDKLKTAYDLAQVFKQWYSIGNRYMSREEITKRLVDWYWCVTKSGVEEFKSVVKMIRKHENEIINFFICGQTNAKAERLNGKINRFISNNYGMKDKDFALYRMAKYFS